MRGCWPQVIMCICTFVLNLHLKKSLFSIEIRTIHPLLYFHLILFAWEFKPRFILTTHAFDLVKFKRSWHSTEDGSVIVGVERVSVTNRYPACTCISYECYECKSIDQDCYMYIICIFTTLYILSVTTFCYFR